MLEKEYRALPCLRPEARIKIVAFHKHRDIEGAPLTIQTPEGHFRVPRVLTVLANKAFDALGDGFSGPDEGHVNELLKILASGARDEVAVLVDALVEEALGVLKERISDAVERLDGRGLLLGAVVQALAKK